MRIIDALDINDNGSIAAVGIDSSDDKREMPLRVLLMTRHVVTFRDVPVSGLVATILAGVIQDGGGIIQVGPHIGPVLAPFPSTLRSATPLHRASRHDWADIRVRGQSVPVLCASLMSEIDDIGIARQGMSTFLL